MYKKKTTGILFITPMILLILIFLVYPFIVNIFDSFSTFDSWTGVRSWQIINEDGGKSLVGFSNYTRLLSNSRFHNALINTSILMLAVIIFQVGLALILALLVNRVNRMQSFYKVSFFIPIIISATALGLMFAMFYRGGTSDVFVNDQGAINQLLVSLNRKPITWLGADAARSVVMFSVMFPVVWQYIGFYFVIFLTGLTTISGELLEAADIDGANEIQKVFQIQIPLLQNIIRVVMVLAITGTLKVFDLPFILNPLNEPVRKGYFLGTLMHALSGYSNKGMAAAFAVILVILGVVLSGVSNILFKQNKDI